MIEVHDGEFAVRRVLRLVEAIESRMTPGQFPWRQYESLLDEGDDEAYYFLSADYSLRVYFRGRREEREPPPCHARQIKTHVVSIEPTVILVCVRLYESLEVVVLVQQGVAGRGSELSGDLQNNVHDARGVRRWHGKEVRW